MVADIEHGELIILSIGKVIFRHYQTSPIFTLRAILSPRSNPSYGKVGKVDFGALQGFIIQAKAGKRGIMDIKREIKKYGDA